MVGFFAVVVTWFTTFLLVLIPGALAGFAIGKLPIAIVWAVLLSAAIAFVGPYLWMAEHIGNPLSDRDDVLFKFGSTSIFAALLLGLSLARARGRRI